MKLIIDIGNSVIKMVAFRGDEPVDELRAENGDLSGLAAFVGKHSFRQGIVGAVRNLTPSEEKALDSLPFPLLRFTSDTPIPITCRYRTPETLGSDRLAAVVGASSLKPNTDLLIIDAGTCITYEVIDARGNYWGGNDDEVKFFAYPHFQISKAQMEQLCSQPSQLGRLVVDTYRADNYWNFFPTGKTIELFRKALEK